MSIPDQNYENWKKSTKKFSQKAGTYGTIEKHIFFFNILYFYLLE
jgi:hypothetical protein